MTCNEKPTKMPAPIDDAEAQREPRLRELLRHLGRDAPGQGGHVAALRLVCCQQHMRQAVPHAQRVGKRHDGLGPKTQCK